ncbi:helix-turn-helix domain-containing protein [Streptomyces jumonjinensis]|uniref:helix-turn-helix domain-containing protein n=1 Tax=Streptomyces jumonjinensis TaxID=1945 RepID=UPI0037BB0028
MQPDGPKIRRQRELSGYGLRKFANAAQVSHGHLSRIERGLKGAQPEVMRRIAHVLGCDISDIQRDTQRVGSEPSDEQDPAPHHDQGTGGIHP